MRGLAMDFQPVFMAGYSLKEFDASHWERRVRPCVVPQTRATCSICGFVAEERRFIHADEVWAFPGPPRVTLIDVRPLCTKCHEAKDFAQTLILIATGIRDKKREVEIRGHYRAVNGCSDDEFDVDFRAAAEAKRKLELSYGCNNVPEVDYGDWGRPKETPRLTTEQQRLLKNVFEVHGEVMIGSRVYTRLSNAVRALQGTPLAERKAIFSEIENALEVDDDSDDWPDHECPWDIKMVRD